MGSKITDDLLGIDPPQLPEPPPPPAPPTFAENKPAVEAAGKKVRNMFPTNDRNFFSNGFRGYTSPAGRLASKTLLGG
ncbi:MAG: hypothetical protein C4542_06050 [Dehalococcoidia bacterium]|nr:MAG: hypothetical protein C4542_06050 [Dehalococcoidia bacterium]